MQGGNWCSTKCQEAGLVGEALPGPIASADSFEKIDMVLRVHPPCSLNSWFYMVCRCCYSWFKSCAPLCAAGSTMACLNHRMRGLREVHGATTLAPLPTRCFTKCQGKVPLSCLYDDAFHLCAWLSIVMSAPLFLLVAIFRMHGWHGSKSIAK